jgi:hypothetical protein
VGKQSEANVKGEVQSDEFHQYVVEAGKPMR